jgi:aminoglycoside/choline kinase family phosphotransferase
MVFGILIIRVREGQTIVNLERYILPILRHHARVWGRMTNLFSNCSQNMSDFACLQEWVEKFLPASHVLQKSLHARDAIPGKTSQEISPSELSLSPLNGDAGFRQYFRLNTEPSLIAVLAPPVHENNPAFVNISLCFQEAGIRTPLIIAVDYQSGFLLLEDFGDDLLLPQLSPNTVDELYWAAEAQLLKIQQIKPNTEILPHYDGQRLRDEMNLFPHWFAEQLLGLELRDSDNQILEEAFSLLVNNALEQPQVVVHRDFHARNLMLLENDAINTSASDVNSVIDTDSFIGVIDFQDAVIGPFAYDMVSLLRDCYIRWPKDYVNQRALDYSRRAEIFGIIPNISDEQITRWFDLMGLQRHIKVLGIFARLWLRDGKQGYLNDLPLVIRYTLEQLEPYPELKEFKDWFEQRVLPQLPQQSWYQSWEIAGD